jgi:hypothetical protein
VFPQTDGPGALAPLRRAGQCVGSNSSLPWFYGLDVGTTSVACGFDKPFRTWSAVCAYTVPGGVCPEKFKGGSRPDAGGVPEGRYTFTRRSRNAPTAAAAAPAGTRSAGAMAPAGTAVAAAAGPAEPAGLRAAEVPPAGGATRATPGLPHVVGPVELADVALAGSGGPAWRAAPAGAPPGASAGVTAAFPAAVLPDRVPHMASMWAPPLANTPALPMRPQAVPSATAVAPTKPMPQAVHLEGHDDAQRATPSPHAELAIAALPASAPTSTTSVVTPAPASHAVAPMPAAHPLTAVGPAGAQAVDPSTAHKVAAGPASPMAAHMGAATPASPSTARMGATAPANPGTAHMVAAGPASPSTPYMVAAGPASLETSPTASAPNAYETYRAARHPVAHPSSPVVGSPDPSMAHMVAAGPTSPVAHPADTLPTPAANAPAAHNAAIHPGLILMEAANPSTAHMAAAGPSNPGTNPEGMVQSPTRVYSAGHTPTSHSTPLRETHLTRIGPRAQFGALPMQAMFPQHAPAYAYDGHVQHSGQAPVGSPRRRRVVHSQHMAG